MQIFKDMNISGGLNNFSQRVPQFYTTYCDTVSFLSRSSKHSPYIFTLSCVIGQAQSHVKNVFVDLQVSISSEPYLYIITHSSF